MYDSLRASQFERHLQAELEPRRELTLQRRAVTRLSTTRPRPTTVDDQDEQMNVDDDDEEP